MTAGSAASSGARELQLATADLGPDDLVLVGCSGGADSLALAVLAAQLPAAGGPRAGALIVDHQLQSGSAAVAVEAARACRELGLAPVLVLTVDVQLGSGNGGLEAAARVARRRAMTVAAAAESAAAVLLAHTLDDQAETVLLGLARGSGARSMAAMRPKHGLWRRPLLAMRRREVRQIVAAADLVPHEDPHNRDPSFARVRVRDQVLPTMTEALGEGIVSNLTRSAGLLRADVEALDVWTATEVSQRVSIRPATDPEVPATVFIDTSNPTELAQLPSAIRTRVLRSAMLAAGVPAGSLTSDHLLRGDALVVSARATAAIRLPADFQLGWVSDKLAIYPAGPMHPNKS